MTRAEYQSSGKTCAGYTVAKSANRVQTGHEDQDAVVMEALRQLANLLGRRAAISISKTNGIIASDTSTVAITKADK